jgi:hypothetical protein
MLESHRPDSYRLHQPFRAKHEQRDHQNDQQVHRPEQSLQHEHRARCALLFCANQNRKKSDIEVVAVGLARFDG